MRSRWTSILAGFAAAAVGLGLTGCSWNAGPKAEQEIADHFTSRYADDVIRVDAHTISEVPGRPTLATAVVLRPETSPQVFEAVYADLVAFEPSTSVDYQPIGVDANGIGVCPGDGQREAKQALRTRLQATGQSLKGSWTCAGNRPHRMKPYTGTLQDFAADAATVRPLLATAPEVTVDAALREPEGSVTGPWSRVPATLKPTLDTIARDQQISRFALDGNRLRVAVQPTSDLSATRTAAERAAGSELEVEVHMGSLDGSQDPTEAGPEEFGPVVDALRRIPGVTRVEVTTATLRVTVADPSRLVSVHDEALALPEFTSSMHLQLLVGERPQQSEYTRAATSSGGHVQAFADLVAAPPVTHVKMIEAGDQQEFWLRVNVSEPIVTAAPRLKPIIPEGMLVEFYSPSDRALVTITARDQITEADVRTRTSDLDPAEIVRAWNAA